MKMKLSKKDWGSFNFNELPFEQTKLVKGGTIPPPPPPPPPPPKSGTDR